MTGAFGIMNARHGKAAMASRLDVSIAVMSPSKTVCRRGALVCVSAPERLITVASCRPFLSKSTSDFSIVPVLLSMLVRISHTRS